MNYVTHTNGSRYRSRQRLEVGYLTRRMWRFVFFARDNSNGMSKAANVDETKIPCKKHRSDHQPSHNQRKFSPTNIDRHKYNIDHGAGDRLERTINRLIYSITHKRFLQAQVVRLLQPGIATHQ